MSTADDAVRSERLGQLVGAFVKTVLVDLYRDVRAHNKNPVLILREFQDALEKVPRWEQAHVRKMLLQWKDAEKVNALWSRLSVEKKQPLDAIVHQSCINCARQMWRRPDIIYHNLPAALLRDNMLALDFMTRDIAYQQLQQCDNCAGQEDKIQRVGKDEDVVIVSSTTSEPNVTWAAADEQEGRVDCINRAMCEGRNEQIGHFEEPQALEEAGKEEEDGQQHVVFESELGQQDKTNDEGVDNGDENEDHLVVVTCQEEPSEQIGVDDNTLNDAPHRAKKFVTVPLLIKQHLAQKNKALREPILLPSKHKEKLMRIRKKMNGTLKQLFF